MNAKTALCMALLEGKVLNVGNCFREVGYTNIAREIPRLVETPFGVEISRVKKEGKNRYGTPVSYVNYRLNRTLYNEKGVKLMEEYVTSNGGMLAKVPVGRPKIKEDTQETEKLPTYIPQKLF